MKYTALTAILVALLLAAAGKPAQATEVGYGRKVGLGFVLGDPTGVTGKLWVGPTNAVDATLGFANYGTGYGPNCPIDANGNQRCYGYFYTTINVDYLWQSNIVRQSVQLDWYIGGGGRVVLFGGRGFNAGARLPVGLAAMFNNPSFVEVFFEIVPAFYVFAPAGLTFEAGLGVRFYF